MAADGNGSLRIGVLFDMDGVLVASGPAHSASWRVLARRHGLTISDALFRDTFGKPSRDIIRQIWGADTPDEQIRRLDEEKEAVYRELVRGMVPLTIGVRELLDTLARAAIPLAVATSGPPENVALVLEETGIGPYFRATVHGFDIRRGKPAPDCFLLAAERIGLPPQACVVVEDAPVGIEAGLAAGCRVVALVGTHPAERLRAAGAHDVVCELREITRDRLKALFAKD